MFLIKTKKITAGTRHQIKLAKNKLIKNNKFIKNLVSKKYSSTGRGRVTGHITVRHKGGGCKFLFRKINFTNIHYNSVVLGIMYDPNRNAFIALNFDLEKKLFFNSIALLHIYPGSLVACQNLFNSLKLGYRTKLVNISLGTFVCCVAQTLSTTALYSRAAGSFCQLLQKNKSFATLKLPSGAIIHFSLNAYATIGVVSNILANKVCIGKAGRNRLLNKRPSVRGIAMNPVDHPHGGRSNGGMPPVTPWGIPTKGKPTVKKKKYK